MVWNAYNLPSVEIGVVAVLSFNRSDPAEDSKPSPYLDPEVT